MKIVVGVKEKGRKFTTNWTFFKILLDQVHQIYENKHALIKANNVIME
jgi:hypothetical protein